MEQAMESVNTGGRFVSMTGESTNKKPAIYVLGEVECVDAAIRFVNNGQLCDLIHLDDSRHIQAGHRSLAPACLVFDADPCGASVPHVELRDCSLPRIAIASAPKWQFAVKVMQSGCLTMLSQNTSPQKLAEVIRQALDVDRHQLNTHRESEIIKIRAGRLTPQERDVMLLAVEGKANREIAAQLRCGLRTVETRRSAMMSKMEASSFAELVRLALRGDLLDHDDSTR